MEIVVSLRAAAGGGAHMFVEQSICVPGLLCKAQWLLDQWEESHLYHPTLAVMLMPANTQIRSEV